MKKSELFKLVKEEWIKHKHQQAILNEADSALVPCQQDSSGGWKPHLPMGGPNDAKTGGGGPHLPMGGPNDAKTNGWEFLPPGEIILDETGLWDYDFIIYCKTTPTGLEPVVKGEPGLQLRSSNGTDTPAEFPFNGHKAKAGDEDHPWPYNLLEEEEEIIEYYGCKEALYEGKCGGINEAEKATDGKEKKCGNLVPCPGGDSDCPHDGYSCVDGCCIIACKEGESDTECKARQKKSLQEKHSKLNNLIVERFKKLANIKK